MPSVEHLETPQTSWSLIGNVRNGSSDAWARLADSYALTILRWVTAWCQQRGILDEALHADAAQGILMSIPQKMKSYERRDKHRYRQFLRRIVTNATVDTLRHLQVARNAEQLYCLQNENAQQDLHDRLEKYFDFELLQIALNKLRLRLAANERSNPLRWKAFELSLPEPFFGGKQLDAETVARQLHVDLDYVYRAKNELTGLLKEELQKMGEENGAGRIHAG